MSYEITTKEFSTTSYLTLATSIASYIAEQVPELSVARTYTSSSTVKCPFLSWDGTKAGLGLYGYLGSSTYPVDSTSNYLRMFVAGNITSTTAKQIYDEASASSYSSGRMSYSCKTNHTVSNGTYYVNTTVSIIKLSGGYIISIGESGIYIGYHTSPIYGKCIVAFTLTPNNSTNQEYKGFSSIGELEKYAYNHFMTDYYNYSCIFSEDGSEYYNGQGVTFVPSTDNITDDNAILSPIYFVCRDLWIEPFVIPDIYHMTARTYPNVYEEAQVGDMTLYRATNYGRIVVV